MKLLRRNVGWARSRADAVWRMIVPHAGPGIAGGVAADVARRRRELVLENAMLRHQIVIPRRKSPQADPVEDRLALPPASDDRRPGRAPWATRRGPRLS